MSETWRLRAGWAGVILSAVAASFFALLWAAQSVTSGAVELRHLVSAALIIGVGLLALPYPQVGGACVIVGVMTLAEYGLVGGYWYWGLTLGAPLIVIGALLYYGRPTPKSTAAWLILGLPAIAALLAAAWAAVS